MPAGLDVEIFNLLVCTNCVNRLEHYVTVNVSNTQSLVENKHWLGNVRIILLYSVCSKYFCLQQTLSYLSVSYFLTDFAADHKYTENFTQNFPYNFSILTENIFVDKLY